MKPTQKSRKYSKRKPKLEPNLQPIHLCDHRGKKWETYEVVSEKKVFVGS